MSSLAYILKRVLHGIPVLLAVITLTFFIMHAVPGGPFDRDKALPPEILKNIEAKYHLDKPLWQQYLLYVKQALQGDLGPSYKYVGRSVSEIIAETLPISAALGLLSGLFVIALGLPLGVLGASLQNAWVQRSFVLVSTLGISVPSFVLASLMVYLFSHRWHILPPALWEGPVHAVMPAIALGAGYAGYVARLIRSSILEVFKADYIRTARAKGLSESVVVLKHALSNAMSPVISVMGPILAGLITGSFVIEYIFAIPGMGNHFITAVSNRDYPLIMGVTLVYSVLIILANLIVDLLYLRLDPRIEFLEEKKL